MSTMMLNSRHTGTLVPSSASSTSHPKTLQAWDITVSCPSSVSENTVRNTMIAGYTAGVFGVLIGQPMDCLKVWAQTEASQTQTLLKPPHLAAAASTYNPAKATNISSVRSSLKPACAPSSNKANTVSTKNMSTLALSDSQSARHSPVVSTVSRMRALYSGVQGPLMLVGMVQSINFAVYDGLRRWLYYHEPLSSHKTDSNGSNVVKPSYLHNDPLSNVVMAASATGALLSFLTSPFLVIKTRQQLCRQGFGEAVRTMVKQNMGLRKTFYVGFGPHFLTETLGRAAYFGTYEALKRSLVSKQEGSMNLSLAERMVCAGTAGVASWSVIFPLDALKSRMYASNIHASSTSVSPNSWQMAVSIVRQEQSLRSLYRGFGVTILRAGPVAAAVLPLYDTVLERLNSSSAL